MVCMHAHAVEVCRLENYTVIAPVIGLGVEVETHTRRTSKVSAVVDFVGLRCACCTEEER